MFKKWVPILSLLGRLDIYNFVENKKYTFNTKKYSMKDKTFCDYNSVTIFDDIYSLICHKNIENKNCEANLTVDIVQNGCCPTVWIPIAFLKFFKKSNTSVSFKIFYNRGILMKIKKAISKKIKVPPMQFMRFRFWVNTDSANIEEKITKILGIEPTETTLTVDEPEIYSFHLWRYYSKDAEGGAEELNDLLSEFLGKIKNSTNEFNAYISTLDNVSVGMCIEVAGNDNDEPYEIYISKENIRLLSDLNCLLQVDIV